jgi:hypothetical protein
LAKTWYDRAAEAVDTLNHSKCNNYKKFYQIGYLKNDAPQWRLAIYDTNPKNWAEKTEIMRGASKDIAKAVEAMVRSEKAQCKIKRR